MKQIILNENQVINDYLNGENAYLLGSKYNCSHSTIINLLKRNNVPRRKISELSQRYSLNKSYFEIIDTPDKAYFLGLLYSDGCVKSDLSSTVINLQEEDCYILETFKRYLKSNSPLHKKVSKNTNYKIQLQLTINSKKLCEDLIKLGCVPRKSLILTFPTEDQVPEKYIWHFMRGCFDGDGCISLAERKIGNKYYKEPKLQLVGSRDFITGFEKLVTTHLNKFNIYPIKESTYNFTTSNEKDIFTLLNVLYKDKSDLFLSRKFNKSEEIRAYYNSKKFFYKNEKIEQYDLSSQLIKVWKNVDEVVENSINYNTQSKQCILRCLRGKIKTAFGFKWKIKNEN